MPKGWIFTKIKNLSTLYNGDSINSDVKKIKYTNISVGLNYIGTKDIGYDNKINYENGVKISDFENFKICPAGKVLLCIEGGNAGNKIALSSEEVCFGNKLLCFNTYYFNDLFLFVYLQTTIFKNIFKSKETGLIGGVSIQKIGESFIPVPPEKEQARIIDIVSIFLNKINSLNKLTNEIDTLKQKIKTKIIELGITGKLLSTDDNYYCEKIELSKCGKLYSGRDLILNKINKFKVGIPYITGASQVTDNCELLINRWTDKPEVISKQGDVLITVKGTIGKTAINNVGLVHIARQIMAFRCNDNWSPQFIHFNFIQEVNNLNQLNNSLIPGIRRENLLNLKINNLPIEKQNEICKKINKFVSVLATF